MYKMHCLKLFGINNLSTETSKTTIASSRMKNLFVSKHRKLILQNNLLRPVDKPNLQTIK